MQRFSLVIALQCVDLIENRPAVSAMRRNFLHFEYRTISGPIIEQMWVDWVPVLHRLHRRFPAPHQGRQLVFFRVAHTSRKIEDLRLHSGAQLQAVRVAGLGDATTQQGLCSQLQVRPMKFSLQTA